MSDLGVSSYRVGKGISMGEIEAEIQYCLTCTGSWFTVYVIKLMLAFKSLAQKGMFKNSNNEWGYFQLILQTLHVWDKVVKLICMGISDQTEKKNNFGFRQIMAYFFLLYYLQ